MCVSPRSENGSSFPAHNFPVIQFKALDYTIEVRFKCVFYLRGIVYFSVRITISILCFRKLPV